MTSNITIRPLAARDSFQALSDLLHRAYAPLADQGLNFTAATQAAATTRKRAAEGQCFVAVAGRELVGTVTVCGPYEVETAPWTAEVPWFRERDTAHFHQFAVDPAYQGRGLGRRLVQVCEDWARKGGFRRMALDTAEPATQLRALYLRLGYADVGQVQWAGKNYGQIFLPRVGQEVVVSFIDGNPDRPLITGAVYNAEQTVPYPLPDNQTRSTTKTRSSKGGGGFNELRLEDKKDSEEIYIHAQKDLKTEVKHDRSVTIDNEDTLTVKKNRTVEVTEGDESLTVKKGKRTVTVEKDYKLTVKGNLTIEVDGNVTIKSKKAIKFEAETTFDLKSGKDMTVKAGGDLQEEAQLNLQLKAGIGLKQEGVTVETKASAQGTVDGGGMLTLKGGLVKIN